MFRTFFKTLEFIKFSHTIFAFPFALMAMMIAAGGIPEKEIWIGIVICLVGARTAAMGFNRYLDWEIDLRNPRTQIRSQLGTKKTALLLTVIGVTFFGWGVSKLNFLCQVLAPVALLLVLGYSWLKRVTIWCHLGLGLALASAPLGAWAAVRGDLYYLTPWLLGFGVFCWVFGFDLIYATQDIDCDQREGLFSIPSSWGVERSLRMARVFHGFTFFSWVILGFYESWGWIFGGTLVGVAVALIYEHWICRNYKDLAAVNRAFFFTNGVIGIILFLGVGWSVIQK